MDNAAAPHSTASIWMTVGVFTRFFRRNRGMTFLLWRGTITEASMGLSYTELFLNIGEKKAHWVLFARDYQCRADRAA